MAVDPTLKDLSAAPLPPLFQGLNSKSLKFLNISLINKLFQKGDILFIEGDRCERIMFVRSGNVKIFKTSTCGREQILEILGPGESCACHGNCPSWNCCISAQALTPCLVSFLPHRGFQFLLSIDHKFAEHLNQILTQKLLRVCSVIEKVALDTPARRLAKFILEVCQSQKSSPSEGGIFNFSFTHEEIAQRVGLVRETVTRHLLTFKRLKLIAIESRQVIILDNVGLEKILQ